MEVIRKLWDLCIGDPEFLAAVRTIVNKIWASLKTAPESVDLPEFDAAIAEITGGTAPEAPGDLIGLLRKVWQLAKDHPELLAALKLILGLL